MHLAARYENMTVRHPTSFAILSRRRQISIMRGSFLTNGLQNFISVHWGLFSRWVVTDTIGTVIFSCCHNAVLSAYKGEVVCRTVIKTTILRSSTNFQCSWRLLMSSRQYGTFRFLNIAVMSTNWYIGASVSDGQPNKRHFSASATIFRVACCLSNSGLYLIPFF